MGERTGFQLEDVHFSYPGKTALAGVSLALVPGKFYGLVGPNGCGKTTLLDVLMANRRPRQGRVLLDGMPVGALARRELARQVALVPQDFSIPFAFTVLEVVLMGRHPYLPRFGAPGPKDMGRAEEAMAALDISELRERPVTELSGGERQRVVVARALAQDTPILLLDEATSNLDIGHSLMIFQVARERVRQGGTVIAVVHNLNLAAAYCDELVFLQKGRVGAAGPTGSTLTSAVIAEVFGVESRVAPDDFSGSLRVSFRYGVQ
ncbi:MAG: ABC transporter ATP-binding protein [Thermodesulfobacteriota bacterium]